MVARVQGGQRLRWKVWVVLLLLGQFILRSDGQQELKYVAAGKNPNIVTPQFSSNPLTPTLMNTGTQFTKAASICVKGMWALYNTTNWGVGIDDPNLVSVISIRSTDLTACTQPNSITQLKSVQSLNFLGNADPTMDGISIFTESSFLGGSWSPAAPTVGNPVGAPAGTTGFRLGSFAITGPSSSWVICGDVNCVNSVCIDMTMQAGGLYLIRNTLTDPNTPWPRVVRMIMVVTSSQCLQYTNPPPQTLLQTRSRAGQPLKPIVQVG